MKLSPPPLKDSCLPAVNRTFFFRYGRLRVKVHLSSLHQRHGSDWIGCVTGRREPVLCAVPGRLLRGGVRISWVRPNSTGLFVWACRALRREWQSAPLGSACWAPACAWARRPSRPPPKNVNPPQKCVRSQSSYPPRRNGRICTPFSRTQANRTRTNPGRSFNTTAKVAHWTKAAIAVCLLTYTRVEAWANTNQN